MMPRDPRHAPAILAFLRRLSRTAFCDLTEAFVAEGIRTGGGVLFPMAERHAGRALIDLHGLTATGHTMDEAQRNWRKMAWSALDHANRHPAPAQVTPQPQGARA